jgi:hypothetical protein
VASSFPTLRVFIYLLLLLFLKRGCGGEGRALSMLAGYERARLDALRAYQSALMSASFEKLLTDALQTAWDCVEETLKPLVVTLASGHRPYQSFVISPLDVTYEAGVRLAKVRTPVT